MTNRRQELSDAIDEHKDRLEQVLGTFTKRFFVSAEVSYSIGSVERLLAYRKDSAEFVFLDRRADGTEWGNLLSKSMEIRVEASKHFEALWAKCLEVEAERLVEVKKQTESLETFLRARPQ